MRIYLIALGIIVLLILAGCSTGPTSQPSSPAKTEFQRLCEQNGHMWMDMKPMRDGRILEDQDSCLGCMPDGKNHFCELGQYKKFIGS